LLSGKLRKGNGCPNQTEELPAMLVAKRPEPNGNRPTSEPPIC